MDRGARAAEVGLDPSRQEGMSPTSAGVEHFLCLGPSPPYESLPPSRSQMRPTQPSWQLVCRHSASRMPPCWALYPKQAPRGIHPGEGVTAKSCFQRPGRWKAQRYHPEPGSAQRCLQLGQVGCGLWDVAPGWFSGPPGIVVSYRAILKKLFFSLKYLGLVSLPFSEEL